MNSSISSGINQRIKNLLGLGEVGQASSNLASEQDPHPTPPLLHQPSPIVHGIPESTK